MRRKPRGAIFSTGDELAEPGGALPQGAIHDSNRVMLVALLKRFGTEVSRGLAGDLAAVSGPLFADPGARAAFAGPGGAPLRAGERLV